MWLNCRVLGAFLTTLSRSLFFHLWITVFISFLLPIFPSPSLCLPYCSLAAGIQVAGHPSRRRSSPASRLERTPCSRRHWPRCRPCPSPRAAAAEDSTPIPMLRPSGCAEERGELGEVGAFAFVWELLRLFWIVDLDEK